MASSRPAFVVQRPSNQPPRDAVKSAIPSSRSMACQACRLQSRLLARKASLLPGAASRSSPIAFFAMPSAPAVSRGLSSTSSLRQEQKEGRKGPELNQSSAMPPPPAPKLPRNILSALTAGPYARIRLASALYGSCAKAGAYEVPEELRKNDTVPTTEDGSEIGVAQGPWYNGWSSCLS